ncbi:hypothetical protein IG631_10594 [Alternaria alternata]|nr:hypothetical protein IG631_10594 [Alternaria alternata]
MLRCGVVEKSCRVHVSNASQSREPAVCCVNKRKAAALNGFGSRNRASFRKAISGIWGSGGSAPEAESLGQALRGRGSIMPCRRLIGPRMKHHVTTPEHHSHSSTHQRYFPLSPP